MNVSEIEKATGYKFEKGWCMANKILNDNSSCGFSVCVKKPNGELNNITGKLDAPIYISSKEYATTRREIIQYLYNPTEEEWCYHSNHYSLKTKNYLDKIASKIGFLGVKSNIDNLIENETTTKVAFFSNITLSRVADEWYVQKCSSYIDDWSVTTYVFNHKPSEKEMQTALKIEYINYLFLVNKVTEEFACWECGTKTHWVDTAGSFDDKADHLCEKYCGC